MKNIIDPKNKERGSTFYYYAGYSLDFAIDVIANFTSTNSSVLDPWNGAGTTTLAATYLGRKSVGVDLNPAVILVAKARLARLSLLNAPVAAFVRYITNFKTPKKIHLAKNDILHMWLDDKSAKALRFLIGELNSYFGKLGVLQIQEISNEHALILKIIAEGLKSHLKPFLSSNPTWIKLGVSEATKVTLNLPDFLKEIQQRLEQHVSSRTSVNLDSAAIDPSFLCQDSRNLRLQQDFDLVLGSPPYCTRIDYAVKTLPEAGVLGVPIETALVDFRRKVLGSTITSNMIVHDASDLVHLGEKCQKFLNEVHNHSSKASATYYYKFHQNYYCGLYESIKSSTRHLKTGGHIVMVVQDSYYKEIHNDLPGITEQMLTANHVALVTRRDFVNNGSFSLVNSASNVYGRRKKYTESVIIGRKK